MANQGDAVAGPAALAAVEIPKQPPTVEREAHLSGQAEENSERPAQSRRPGRRAASMPGLFSQL